MNPTQLLAQFDRISDAPVAVPRLRSFILDLGVRGKLVEQNPKDEPASELLKRIQEKKTRLVKGGTISEQSLQAEIETNEIPFALPDLWACARLGDVIHLVSGQHLQPDEYSDQKQSGPPYITGPADFAQNGLVITRYAVVRKAVAKKGQILLTVKGAGLGKTAICDLPEVAISRQLMAMTAIEWSQQFLLLLTHRLAETLKGSARSLIPGISREDVDQFVCALPPLAEQHRIVAKVNELMALCDRLEAVQVEREDRRDRLAAASLNRLNQLADDPSLFQDHARFYFNHLPRLTTRCAHIEQLRQTILSLAIRGRLAVQDPNETVGDSIPEIRPQLEAYDAPKNWRWTEFGEVAAISGGFAFKSGDYAPSGVFVLRVTNIEPSGVITKSDAVYLPKEKVSHEIERFYLNAGDILLVMVGGSLGKIGVVTPESLPALLNQNLWRITPANGEIDRQFLKLLIDFIVSFQRKITHSTHGHLSREDFRKKPIPLPPLAEQQRIVARVEELMALCSRLEAQLATSQTESGRLLEAVLHHAVPA
jgi:type I restriction enzyme, S subunit